MTEDDFRRLAAEARPHITALCHVLELGAEDPAAREFITHVLNAMVLAALSKKDGCR